jgi:type III restriction enzyme
MPPAFQLKEYQDDVLKALRDYFVAVAAQGDHGARFTERTGAPYVRAPAIAGVPHICLRVPTGGGKTILAAHAIPVAAQTIMRTDCPVVIWFTPSTVIRDQTLKSLRDRSHPNRRALGAVFGENVRVMERDEALHARRPDYDGGAVVIVSTVQAFRADPKADRKVYEANGDLMDHFSGLPRELLATLEQDAAGGHVWSLANVVRLRRPLVITDEAHNMSTQLSFDTLARLNPSAIIEFTATPTTPAEQNPSKGKFASNVLYHVTAAKLKLAEMIKMPIVLRGRADPKETIGDAMQKLRDLEELAQREERATRAFIRPVMLLQAEAESQDKPTLHAEELKKLLLDSFPVAADEIAISTSKRDDLETVDLFKRDCRIRYIITQQKLREGWDCSFAYVLCSVAPQKSERSVEQLLGRILRLPYATRKQHEDLNTAFAYATTTSFQQTAEMLKEGLVASGFDPGEAETAVHTPQLYGFEAGGAAYRFEETIPAGLDPEPVKARIEAATLGRVTVDLENRKIVTGAEMSQQDRMHVAMAWPEAAPVIDALHRKSWNLRNAAATGERFAFTVPGLAVRVGAQFELFSREHFFEQPWPLEKCDPSPIVDDFVDVPEARAVRFDVDEQGKLGYGYEESVARDLFARGAEWSRPALIYWLDRRLGDRQAIMMASARLFIGATLDMLMERRGLTIDELGRARFRLHALLDKHIGIMRRGHETKAWQLALFSNAGLETAVSSDVGFCFDSARESDYDCDKPYRGAARMQKHLFRDIDDLQSTGAELACAIHIDNQKRVRRWVRNVDKKRYAFWLQTPSDRFYPDFIALLDDDRILVVEYKGQTSHDSDEKKRLGELWAAKSGGRCLFVMVEGDDFTAIDRAVAR